MRFNSRAGFTLIELLIVVVILGILATLAIPYFRNTTAKAFGGTLKSDLRNLAAAQESYFYDNVVYATDVSQLAWRPSNDVTVAIVEATPGGWSGRVDHSQADPSTCAVFYGTAAPVAPAVVEGRITCQ